MLPIFKIPDKFDLSVFDSPSHSTYLNDGIFDFTNLFDDTYFSWQEFVRKFGDYKDIKSDIWMEDLLGNSMEPTLYSEVIVEYYELPLYQQAPSPYFV